MRIGIDIGPITRGRTGVGAYCYFLLKHLLAQGPDYEFKGFSCGRRKVDWGNLSKGVGRCHVPIPTRVLYESWNCLGWPKVDRLLGGVDVFHATNYFLPPTATARRVLTIHDLAFLAAPELCSPKIVGPFSQGIRRFAEQADAILAVSKATRRDIVEHLGIAPDKVTVTHEAVDDDFAPVPRDEAVAWMEHNHGLRGPFLLFIGTLEPRKNVPVLLRAFAEIAPSIPHRLVLVGATGWNAEGLLQTLKDVDLGQRIVRLGYVPHSDLPRLYSAADAFVFPSRYEGFGLPLLEAMRCSCPVIAANNSSMPEVAGDAGLLVDADDVSGLAKAMRSVLEDAALRENLIVRGKVRSAMFSWATCAHETLDVYKKVARCESL